MLQKLINIIMYAGMTKKEFADIQQDIDGSTRRSLQVFCMIAGIAMGIMSTASFFFVNLEANRSLYIMVCAISLLLYIVSKTLMKDHPVLVYVGLYLFMGILYMFGIAMGTIVAPNEMTVSFIVLLFAVPLVFSTRPIHMVIINLVAIAVYIILAKINQDSMTFTYNMTNILAYGALSIIVSVYMMRIKAERFAYEQRTRYLSESDQLTGMLNRRSYENHLAKYRREASSDGLTICAFDVNGLKTVNDTLGHRAGDELIIGAADCIQAVFGQYGTCYRTGGDEFMAILPGAAPTAEELTEMLCDRTRSWKGMLVSGMSISLGIVRGSKDIGVDELVGMADKEMYACKANYYKNAGIDRRRS